MKALPYFKWNPADAETDDKYSAMNDAELGFYHRCLNRSWLNDGLPSDLDELARVMKVKRTYLDKVWARVGKCFELTDTVRPRYINKRQEAERLAALTKSQNNKRVGNANAFKSRTDGVAIGLLRAYDSDSVSDSDSSLKKKEGSKKPKLEKVLPPPSPTCDPQETNVMDEHPQTRAAICSIFEDTDEGFIRALITKCSQEVLNAGESLDVLTDEVLAYAVQRCTKPKQQSAGLYLTTVPNWIKNKAMTEVRDDHYAQ